VKWFVSALEIVGCMVLTTGIWLWSVPLGLIAAGIAAIIVGVALERD
jgi:hypothetical protein